MYAAAAVAAALAAAAAALALAALAAGARMRSLGKTCEQRRATRAIARAESKQQPEKSRESRSRKSRIIGGSPAEAKTKVESKGQTESSKQHTQKGAGL